MSEWLKIMSEWLMLRLLKLPKLSTPAKSGGSSRELEQIKVDTSKSISASAKRKSASNNPSAHARDKYG